MSAAPVLVMGASGFLVTRQLVARGDRVRVLLRETDVEDALLLAAEHGRPGERYIVSERFLAQREIYLIAALAGGVPPPRFGIPQFALVAAGRAGSLAARLLRRDIVLNATAVRLLRRTAPLDHGKAERELGWRPGSAAAAIERAARFAVERRRRRVLHP
ncbi:hypothetical protein AB0H71_05645 [Nocardia sp. NPDC050697]|uniref:hypothetical protein n=1 Tax=Nocardia sp. NPDC050697 TaxID=3155158 RepID=UPI003401F38F